MMDVGLAAVPNQAFTVQIDDRVYDFAFREAKGVMAVSITRDEVPLVSALRVTAGTPLLPYRYQESGNFILTVENDALPYYDKFGITQFLVYLTADELAEFRAS